MKICLITPTADVEMTESLPGRFCIATEALKHPNYRDWFAKTAEQGHKVMLDNGVFEEDLITDDELLQLAVDTKASILIAPDILCGDAMKNWDQSVRFAEIAKLSLPDIEMMFVPQCPRGDFGDFTTILTKLACEDHPFKWIGFCRDAIYNAFGKFTNTKDQELNRFFFGAWLEREDFLFEFRKKGLKLHYLGIGDRWDLMQYYHYIDSMDTASIYWRAANGQSLHQLGHWVGTIAAHQHIHKRPYDYFELPVIDKERRHHLVRNCNTALMFAQRATDMRNDLRKGRI